MNKFWRNVRTIGKIVGNATIAIGNLSASTRQNGIPATTLQNQGFIPFDQDDYAILSEDAAAIGKAVKKLKGATPEEQNELDIVKHAENAKADAAKSISINTAETDNKIRELEARERLRQEGALFDFELEKKKKEYSHTLKSDGPSLLVQGKEPPDITRESKKLKDIRDYSFSESENLPIVPGLIWENDFVCIFGAQKTGKSFLGIQIGMDAESGSSSIFPDNKCSIPKCSVFYYASEGRRDNIQSRFPDSFFEEHPNYFVIISDGATCEDVIDDFRKTLNTLPSQSHNLFVIDNLSNLSGNKVRSGHVDVFIETLESFIREAKDKGVFLTIILFAHSNASGEEPFASSYIKKRANRIIRFSGKKRELRHILIIDSGSYIKEDEFWLKPVGVEGDDNKLSFVSVSDSEDCSPEEAKKEEKHTRTIEKEKIDVRCKLTNEEIEEIIKRKNAGERIKDIAEEKGTSMKTLYKWIKKYSEEHKE